MLGSLTVTGKGLDALIANACEITHRVQKGERRFLLSDDTIAQQLRSSWEKYQRRGHVFMNSCMIEDMNFSGIASATYLYAHWAWGRWHIRVIRSLGFNGNSPPITEGRDNISDAFYAAPDVYRRYQDMLTRKIQRDLSAIGVRVPVGRSLRVMASWSESRVFVIRADVGDKHIEYICTPQGTWRRRRRVHTLIDVAAEAAYASNMLGKESLFLKAWLGDKEAEEVLNSELAMMALSA